MSEMKRLIEQEIRQALGNEGIDITKKNIDLATSHLMFNSDITTDSEDAVESAFFNKS